jgi:DnaJ family protein C protein 7
MEVDSEGQAAPPPPPTSPPPQTTMPGTFDAPKTNTLKTNGTASKANGEAAGPVPPPHKSNPTSPAPSVPPTVEDAEAFKTAGNKYYKAREYRKAIEEYTKGMRPT